MRFESAHLITKFLFGSKCIVVIDKLFDVQIDLDHTAGEDLRIFLISPSGQRVELVRDLGVDQSQGQIYGVKFNDLDGDGVQDTGEPGPGGALAGVAGVVQDLSGKGMPLSPKFKFVLGAEQRIPLSAGGNIVLGANYSWRDEAQMLVDQNPYGVQDSFGILNLSVGWKSDSSKLSATLFCNNVFDEHYFTDIQDFWSAPWGGVNTIVGQVARDTNRYFGLRVSAGF